MIPATFSASRCSQGAIALGGEVHQGGKWIEISYGRPLKNGRDLWGSGADYGKAALAGTPIWRAGADVSTQLKTEIPLVIGGKTIRPGVYPPFIDLKEPVREVSTARLLA